MGIVSKHLPESQRAAIARSLFKSKPGLEDKNKGEIHGYCPIHNESTDSTSPSFSYNYQKDSYNCFSCGASGDLIRLWTETKGLSQTGGFKAFCEEYGIELKHDNDSANSRRDRSPNDPQHNPTVGPKQAGLDPPVELTREQVLEQMRRAWDLFPPLPPAMVADLEKKRGWTKEAIEILDLRLETWRLAKRDYDHTKAGDLYQVKNPVKIAIPIRNTKGELINIRLYQPGVKQYKIISFGPHVGDSALFPAQPLKDGPVLLCEGESDTICAFSQGFNPITQTSKLKKWPENHIKPFKGRDVTIAYDADEAGQKYTRFAAEVLTGKAKSLRLVRWPSFMGVDDSGAVPKDHGQDLTDFFVRHQKTAADMQALIDAAAPWPPAPVEVSPGHNQDISSGEKPSDEKASGFVQNDTEEIEKYWDEGVGDRRSFKPRLLAEQILKDYKLLFDPGTGMLYRWNGKYWQEFDREHLEAACTRYLGIEAKQSRITDSSYQARILSTIPAGRSVNDRDGYLCIENGMLNTDTFEIFPHDPDFMATFSLPVSLDPQSQKRCVNFERYLQTSVQDEKSIAQLQEFAGYIISRDTKFEKCLFLLGPGRDGKSKFINAMKDMVGIDNISAVSFPDLEKEFNRSSLYNKMLNSSTEIGTGVIESAYFKAITSGDPIQAAFKHKDNFTFTPYCKLIFAGNILPRIKDNSDALYERILPVRFKRQFLEGDPDRDEHLGEKLKEERSEIFYWALCGLKRLREQRRFTESDETRKLIMEFRRSNNPIICFAEDRCELGDGKEVSRDDLYSEYDKYARRKGYKPTNESNFFRELYSVVGKLRSYQARMGGKRPRIMEGIALKAEVSP